MLPVVFDGNDHVVVVQSLKGQVGGVAGPGMFHHKFSIGQWLCAFENLADVYPLPGIVVPAPRRHTMKIGGQRRMWQSQELFPRQLKRILYQPRDLEFPIGRHLFGRALITQNWSLFRQVLPRWQAVQTVGTLLYRRCRFFTKPLHNYVAPFIYLTA